MKRQPVPVTSTLLRCEQVRLAPPDSPSPVFPHHPCNTTWIEHRSFFSGDGSKCDQAVADKFRARQRSCVGGRRARLSNLDFGPCFSNPSAQDVA